MEMRKFLCMVGEDELKDSGVLWKQGDYGSRLEGRSLHPLLQLMRERGVELLTHEKVWSLNVDGDFVNSTYPRRPKSGNVSQLGEDEFNLVFDGTNTVINPFYIRNPGSMDSQD